MKSPSMIEDQSASGGSITSRARRRFIALLGTGAAATATGALSLGVSRMGHAAPRPHIKAIAFDGLAVFDPRPIAALTESLFPGKGPALTNAWRTRQFEYTWLRTITNTYVDFWQVTDEALTFAAELLKLKLSTQKRSRLMHAFLTIAAWPDAVPVLKDLKARGVSLALLADFTGTMMDACVKNSGLDGVFESHLSTDRVKAYKPDPRAYEMAMHEFGLTRDEIAFVAFAGWDAAGARAFGYQTFWANRLGLPPEDLGFAANEMRRTFTDLPMFISRNRA